MPKKYLPLVFLLFLFVFENSSAQQTYIPDSEFERYLIDNGYDDVFDNYVLTSNINTITSLYIQYEEDYFIFDLTGIEDFTDLSNLNIELYVTTLDLSNNSNLNKIRISKTPVTSLDLPKSNKLYELVLFSKLNSLDLTQNTALIKLYISDSQITNLDLSNNINLNELSVSNSKFSSLDLRNNKMLTKLYCTNNKLEVLNIKNDNNGLITYFESLGNTELNCIEVDDASWSYANWKDIDSWTNFAEDCLSKTNLDGSGALELLLIDCGYDDVEDGYVLTSNINSIKRLYLGWDGNGSSIDGQTCGHPGWEYGLGGIEDFIGLEELSIGGGQPDTNLDLKTLVNLKRLSITEPLVLSNLNLSNNLELTDLFIDGAEYITSLDLTKNTKLKSIIFSYYATASVNITSLDLTKNVVLESLTMEFVPITTLDLSQNIFLRDLSIEEYSPITFLDLSNNTALTRIGLDISASTLDLSKSTQLTEVSIHGENLTSLNLKNNNNKAIAWLNVYSPVLSCFQVDDAAWSAANWGSQYTYSEDCYTLGITHVPDDNFEQALIALGYDDVLDNYVLTDNISGLTFLNVSDKGISDLTGIEGFSNLSQLLCQNNSIKNLDLSTNTQLTRLLCYNNQLTSLDLSQNTKLEELFCDGNQITSIDLSKNLSLLKLKSDNNPIVNLDLTHNLALTNLYINGMQLINIDLTMNKDLSELYCGSNELKSLDLGQNKLLTKLYCSDNQLEALNMKNDNNGLITYFKTTGNTDLNCIQVDNAAWSEANWTNIDSWTNFSEDCPTFGLTYIPDANFEKALIDLGIDSDGIINQVVLTSDISTVNNLSITNKGINDLTGIEDFISLSSLVCDDNLLTSLDTSKNPKLTYLSCNNNQLSSITGITQNLNITVLDIQSNLLTSLNVKNGNNSIITHFDSSNNPNLTCIEVDDVAWSTVYWFTDSWTFFSEDCSSFLNDDDKDGVTNNDDQCPDTPAGETVDANGCSDSQLDDDNDGVMNDMDTCPNTPAGETVDANGCSESQLDDDNDGVMNDMDTCPNTPAGEPVDANGCSDSQLDDDNDGVMNDMDTCPNTPAGEPVDANGCSEAQALGVADEKLDKEIKFFPNPVSTTLTIDTENILIEKVEIYSYLGVKIDEIDSEFEYIQTDKLANGVYIVKIYSEKGSTIRRLIKN